MLCGIPDTLYHIFERVYKRGDEKSAKAIHHMEHRQLHLGACMQACVIRKVTTCEPLITRTNGDGLLLPSVTSILVTPSKLEPCLRFAHRYEYTPLLMTNITLVVIEMFCFSDECFWLYKIVVSSCVSCKREIIPVLYGLKDQELMKLCLIKTEVIHN